MQNEENEDPCKEAEKYKLQIDKLNTKKKEYIEKCNATKYINPEEQKTIFTTLFSLIKYIFENKIEKCQDLLYKFPDSNLSLWRIKISLRRFNICLLRSL